METWTDSQAADVTPDPLTLWAVPVADLGGVARHVLDVAAVGLPGLRLAVLCPEGPLAERLRTLGAAVFVGPFGPDDGTLASVRTLRRLVRTLRPAVVHTHLAYADIVAGIALAGDRKVGLISSEHGIAPDDALYNAGPATAKVTNLAHRGRLARTQRVIAVSESTKRVLEAKWRPRCPVTVVPNGVDLDAVRAAASAERRTVGEGLRVLSLSRLSPEKGLDRLVAAMPLLLQKDPQARLTLAGTGPLAGQLQSQAGRLGVGDAVDLPGFVEPWHTMAQHDVLVQLSCWENLSYTLLDAAAASLPALATDVGGNGEILPAGALLQDPTPEAIVTGVEKVVAGAVGEPHVTGREQMVAAIARVTDEVRAEMSR
ncbi:glycosyltransferase [Micrococcus lylae]|uniref:glycosyltransferase n=1 Tax=Micrococcus lylae TaxID=1273 RepID=UPI003EB7D152